MSLNQEHILIFEWVTGGGLLSDSTEPTAVTNLVTQGRKMLVDVCQDFVSSGYAVTTTIDHRINFSSSLTKEVAKKSIFRGECLEKHLSSLGRTCDWILVIAPETEHCLSELLKSLSKFEPKLLNPSLNLTNLCSDKNALASFLDARKIPSPSGQMLDAWRSHRSNTVRFPCVVKPVDGCGGEHVQKIDDEFALSQVTDTHNYRVEEFVSGCPVSVAAVLGKSPTLYPSLRQTFHGEPFGLFARCEDDLPSEIEHRAQTLARRVIAAFPDQHGFIGIDMIIGDRDVVIEINPRITMSYGKLRSCISSSIAEQMIANRRQTNLAPFV